MIKHLRLWLRALEIEFCREMAYKWNFVLKMFSLAVMDMIGPIVMLIIYSTTSGIPGWSFEEFILFQGTLTLVFGLGHTLIMLFPERVITGVRKGSLDKDLVKPYNPLTYFLLTSWDIEGIAEVVVGLGLIGWAAVKLNLAIFSVNTLLYLILIVTALVFVYSIMIIISAIAIIFVKSHSLYELFFSITRLGKYPFDIYNSGMVFFLTFILPIGVAAFYPVEALLGKLGILGLFKVVLPVIAFLFVSLALWNYGIKKYTSAGG
ncbi:MAG: ABC-2 family transporter protein [Candidatus Woesearchaeota archaeon]